MRRPPLSKAASKTPKVWAAKLKAVLARRPVSTSAEMLQAYRSILAQYPDAAPVRARLALALCDADDPSAGAAQADIVLTAAPATEIALLARGLCRIKLDTTEGAVADLTAALTCNPKRKRTYVALGRELLHSGQMSALQTLTQRMQNAGLEAHPLQLLCARAQLRSGAPPPDPITAEALIKAAPNPQKARATLLTEAYHCDALGYYRDAVLSAVTAAPKAISSYELAAQYLTRIGHDPAVYDLITAAPPAVAQDLAFEINVLLPIYKKEQKVGLAKDILKRGDRAGLPEDAACTIAAAQLSYISDGSEFTRLNEVLQRNPTSRKAHRLKIVMQLRQDRSAALDAKAQAAQVFTPRAYDSLLAVLPSAVWDADDTLRLITQAHARGAGLPLRHRRILLAQSLTQTDPALIRAYLMLADVDDLWCRSVAKLLGWRLQKDAALESPSIMATQIWIKSSIDRKRPHLAQHAHVLHDKITQGGGGTARVLMDTHESADEARTLSDLIRARITDGTPTSVLRLGDGEGNFLPYMPDDLPHSLSDKRSVQHDPWWGQQLIPDAQFAQFETLMRDAVASADILGVPQFSRLLSIHIDPAPVNSRATRGIDAVIHMLKTLAPPPVLTSCNLHVDLEKTGEYNRLFEGLHSISVISCLDLHTVLKTRFGLQIRQDLRIPGEFRFLRELGKLTPQDPRPIYPGVYQQVMEQIAPQPGEVYLVGAGFLGKMMCQRIKNAGGIALDVGSIFDIWCGAFTRKYHASLS